MGQSIGEHQNYNEKAEERGKVQFTFMLSQEVFLLELYSRSQAAAMLGITVRKLDMLRANRLIGYYKPYPGGKVQFSQAHIEKYLQRIEKPPRAITKSR